MIVATVTVRKEPGELDLSRESEKELRRKASIAARRAGFRSLRELELSAYLTVVKEFPEDGDGKREKGRATK